MDINSNKYTFTFAAVMVVVSALMLSTAAISLKPAQDRNIELEKKQSILSTLRENKTREESEQRFADVIKTQLVINAAGQVVDSTGAAFTVDLAAELVKPADQRQLPLFVAQKEGATYYVIPVRGKGLWGPVWGYVSLESDFNTIYGAFFDHKAETPGLGAEISTEIFEPQFQGKKIMDGETFTSILVRKGDATGDHQVNGISGGTITSVGVEAMLKDCLIQYLPYFNANRAPAAAPADTAAAATSNPVTS